MLTRSLTEDSRLMLYMLAAEGIDAAIGALIARWRRTTRRGRLSQNLRNLEAAGLIQRATGGILDERLYRITEQGRQAVFGGVDPETRWGRPWDGVWRMAMFDVPEAHASRRAQFRRKLREMHFGWLQNSVWLTPDPVSQLVEQLKRERAAAESLLFMEGRPAGGETDAELVAAAWDFGKLAKMHASYLKIVRLRPAAGRARAELSPWLATEHRAWREILRHDPLLPESLLPRDYAGRAVWQARREALHAAGRMLTEATAMEQ